MQKLILPSISDALARIHTAQFYIESLFNNYVLISQVTLSQMSSKFIHSNQHIVTNILHEYSSLAFYALCCL